MVDPFQFASRPKRSTENATSSALNLSLAHLEENTRVDAVSGLQFSVLYHYLTASSRQSGTPEHQHPPVLLAASLPHWKTTVIVGHHPQHWLPSGLCSEPLCYLSWWCKTASPGLPPTTWRGLRTTQQRSASSGTGMTGPTERLWNSWWAGVESIMNVDETKEIIFDIRKNQPTSYQQHSTKVLGVHITGNLVCEQAHGQVGTAGSAFPEQDEERTSAPHPASAASL